MSEAPTGFFHYSRPLEKYRAERVMGVGEFAVFLGITEQTYRRLLRAPEKVRMTTRRQVLARLNLPSPYYVTELAPAPTQQEIESVLAALAEGDIFGSIALDPDTLEPTGEVFDNAGNLLRTYDPKTEEPY